jgi:hypothetical protein
MPPKKARKKTLVAPLDVDAHNPSLDTALENSMNAPVACLVTNPSLNTPIESSPLDADTSNPSLETAFENSTNAPVDSLVTNPSSETLIENSSLVAPLDVDAHNPSLETNAPVASLVTNPSLDTSIESSPLDVDTSNPSLDTAFDSTNAPVDSLVTNPSPKTLIENSFPVLESDPESDPSIDSVTMLIETMHENKRDSRMTMFLRDCITNQKSKAVAIDSAYEKLRLKSTPIEIMIIRGSRMKDADFLITDICLMPGNVQVERKRKQEEDEEGSSFLQKKKMKLDRKEDAAYLAKLDKNSIAFKDIIFPKPGSPQKSMARPLKLHVLGTSEIKFSSNSSPYRTFRFLDVSGPQQREGNQEIIVTIFDTKLIQQLESGKVYFFVDGVVPKVYGKIPQKTFNFRSSVKIIPVFSEEKLDLPLLSVDELLSSTFEVPARVNVIGVVIGIKKHPLHFLKIGSMSHLCIDLTVKNPLLKASLGPIIFYNVNLSNYGGMRTLIADSFSQTSMEEVQQMKVLQDWYVKEKDSKPFSYSVSYVMKSLEETKNIPFDHSILYFQLKAVLLDVSLHNVGFLCPCLSWWNIDELEDPSETRQCDTCGQVPYNQLVCSSITVGTFEDSTEKKFEGKIYQSTMDFFKNMTVQNWKEEKDSMETFTENVSSKLFKSYDIVIRASSVYDLYVIHSIV